MLRLKIRDKTKGDWSFESSKSSVFIGRDRSMDVVLNDQLVSRQHAVIIARGPSFILQDIGGRNPVRVNRKDVLSHVLRAGDIIELGESSLFFQGSNAEEQRATSDVSPTVVDARESIERFRVTGGLLTGSADDTTAGSVGSLMPSTELRSQRNLHLLQNFSALMRSLSEPQRLLTAAMDIIFDNLEVKRGFVGFFTPGGQLEIRSERNQGPSKNLSYSRSIVDRVRQEGVAILFSDTPDESQGSTSMPESKSVFRLIIKSAMCLPIFGSDRANGSDRVIGVLYLDNRERSVSFNIEDLYFANILCHLISLALEKEDLFDKIQEENIELKTILRQKNRFVCGSFGAKEVVRKVKKVAAFDTTVLICGESGTGKELVARLIHDRSPRKANPFVAVNCAAIPETLLESELFGYAAKSGISGSDPKGKPGKFELAHGGTLFLDEIGDMSLSTQAKILRAIEDKVVNRLGGMEGIQVDLRIVAATNKVLEKAVQEGTFREDLYYRLKVFKIDLPPLRERREDILPLCQHFLSFLVTENRGLVDLSPRAKELLLAYHWPGNVRELKNAIEEAALLSSGGMVYPENLPGDLRRDDVPQPFCNLADVEAQHISRVLQSVNWNKRRAAEVLGINRSTLYEKIRLYGLERPPDASQTPLGVLPQGVSGAIETAEGEPAEQVPQGTGEALLAERGAAKPELS